MAERTYAFRARESSGEMVTGTIVASNADEVGARLRAEGKYVIMVSEHALTETPELDSEAILRNEAAKRVSRDDVIAFAQQLGVMLETGVPLAEALDSFLKQSRNPALTRVFQTLSDDIRAGERLSSAMSRWPRVFPRIMVSLMKASEASGTMSTMLTRVGHYLSKERRTARQIKGALAYPMFMMTIGVAISIFLVTIILPRFAVIYEQRSASLPVPTRILMDISSFAMNQAHIYLPVLVACGVAVTLFGRHRTGRRLVDWLRLHVPIISTLYGRLYLTRAARTMSTLLAAGVGLLDIIDICRGVTPNTYWDRFWDHMDQQIRNGHQFSKAAGDHPLMPPNVVSMIAAGEKSGRLSEVMERIAEFSEEELENAVRQTTAFIEPVMICVMGVLIGGVAVALLLPIFTISGVMAGR